MGQPRLAITCQDPVGEVVRRDARWSVQEDSERDLAEERRIERLRAYTGGIVSPGRQAGQKLARCQRENGKSVQASNPARRTWLD